MKEKIKCGVCHSSEEINYHKSLESWLCKICSQPKKTLRDEFAMAALQAQAFVTGCYALSGISDSESVKNFAKDNAAKSAYKMADAMLEARKAKGE